MKYSNLILCMVFSLLVACTSQTVGPALGDDFDQQKAAKTRVSLGLTYLKNGNFSQAKFNLDKALEFAPRSADVHYGLAYYYQTVGENDSAEKSYQTAMDYDPNNPDLANSYGAFLCQQGKYPQAKHFFLKAINSSNYISSAETYENLALCSQSQGYQTEASEYLRSAVKHQPGRAKSLYLLTQSLILEENWQEAKDVLRKYEKVAQVNAETLLLSTQIEQGLGNTDIARGYGDMLLKIFPDSQASAIYKARLADVQGAVNPIARKSVKPNVTMAATPLKQTDTAANQVDTLVKPVEKEEKGALIVSDTVKAEEPLLVNGPAFHTVQAGENLYRISLQYNIKMKRLIEWNNLQDASDIFAGKKIRLSAPEATNIEE